MTDVVTSATTGAKVSIYDLYETDSSAEENGKWFKDISGTGSGHDIQIRSFESKRVQQSLRRHQLANQKFAKSGVLPEAITDAIRTRIVAEDILIDWRGFTDREGVEIPFTPENAMFHLTKLKRLRDAIERVASAVSLWRSEQEQAVVGN